MRFERRRQGIVHRLGTKLGIERQGALGLTDVTGFRSTGARWLKDRQVDGRITDRF